MIRDEKLKKVNDIIFQEAEPPSDRNRPLEWRRSFNIIDLEIDKISITSGAQLRLSLTQCLNFPALKKQQKVWLNS